MNIFQQKLFLFKLICLALFFSGVLFFPGKNSYAQESVSSERGVGLSLSPSNSPEESDFSSSSASNDVYLDWMALRVGFNMAQAELGFKLYDKNWLSTLDTSSVYVAYRLTSRTGDSAYDFFSLLGMTYVRSTLSVVPGVATKTSDDYGFMTGGGFVIYLGNFAFGPQFIYFSSKGKFDNIVIATGSIQTQITFKASF